MVPCRMHLAYVPHLSAYRASSPLSICGGAGMNPSDAHTAVRSAKHLGTRLLVAGVATSLPAGGANCGVLMIFSLNNIDVPARLHRPREACSCRASLVRGYQY